jgi:hypothetical protein
LDGEGRALSEEAKIVREQKCGAWAPHFMRGLLTICDGRIFVFENLECRNESGDHEQLLNPVGEVHQNQFAARVLYMGQVADQLTDSGAVDVIHIGQIKDYLFTAFRTRITDRIANCRRAGA